MNKVLLAALMLASAGAHATVGVRPVPSVIPHEFTDRGTPEAIVCHKSDDAYSLVKFAGDNDTEGFKRHVGATFKSKACSFLNTDAQVIIKEHAVVMTDNGPLWIVRFTWKDVTGKFEERWASANYFPVAYPKTQSWDLELFGEESDEIKTPDNPQ